jgi:drug/metabolite transporter (DMT)-like permease
MMKKGYLFLGLAALSYASMGMLIRVLDTYLPPFTQIFFRHLVSFILTLGLIIIKKKKIRLTHRKDYKLILLMGIVGYGLQVFLFTFAIINSKVGNVLFLFSAYSILTAILGVFALKEKLDKKLIISSVLTFIAIILIFNPQNLGEDLLGNSLALFAAGCFAIYIICSKILTKRGNASETITLMSTFLCLIMCGVLMVVFEGIDIQFNLSVVVILALFGLLNFLAWNLVNKGFQYVNAGKGTLVLLIEPIIGSVLGLIFLREMPTTLFIIGAIGMIISIGVSVVKFKKK